MSSAPLPPPALLRSPSRVLVVVTLDAERYTPVDLSNVLDDGAVIRIRILSKLGILSMEEQAKALIYETEIGALAVGEPLTNDSLSKLCHERGDSRASLAFIVQCMSPQSNGIQKFPYSPYSTPSLSIPRSQQLQQRHPPRIADQASFTSSSSRDYSAHPSLQQGAQDHHRLSESPSRRVRPLPATPNSLSTSNPGPSTAGDPNSRIPATTVETDDFYGHSRSVTSHLESASGTVSPPMTIPLEWRRGELIGKGKLGRVYMALETVTRSIMAVKQIAVPVDNSGMRSIIDALKTESQMLRQLDHKNIVKYIHFEETITSVYIFMEYVSGGTLSTFLKDYAPFSENITKFFLGQILEGLAYLHSHRVLHRDLRADNVLVQQDGTCKISDFALSKHADKDGLVYTALQGSLFWMAPEVINTQEHGYSSKVDIWSLGCLLLEMWFDGNRPWKDLDVVSVMLDLYMSKKAPPLPENFSMEQEASDFYSQCFEIDPVRRASAVQLQSHEYLKLPPEWTFKGFVESPVIKTALKPHLKEPPGSISLSEESKHKVPPQFTLDGFPRFSSTTHTPVEWLNANRVDLLEYIIQSKFHTEARQECFEWVKSEILFPRLVIFSHEAVYPLEALQCCVEEWRTWDTLTSLCRFKKINDKLRSFYIDMDEVHELRALVALDVDAMCARLYGVVNNIEEYRRLLELRSDDAQSMLDVFQTLLDISHLDKRFKSPFLNAMLRLSKRSGLHPSHLLQREVYLEGVDAIAAGQFGDVWKGRFRNRPVAVKVLKIYMTSDLVKHLKNVLHEMLIWRQLRHPNVLPFLCLHHVNNNGARLGLVSPWMENGNVRTFLQTVPNVNRVSLTKDIAEGVKYLHGMQPNIIHGDLKAANILISNSHRACLADFGLSKASDSEVLNLSSSSELKGGTSRWTSPELLDGTQITNNIKTDVYAFACVCYEIFSGNIPFAEIKSDYPIILKVIQGERPERPSQCEPWKISCVSLGLDDDLWEIIEHCWDADPNERPTMTEVIDRLPPLADPRPSGIEDGWPPDMQQQMSLITWSAIPPSLDTTNHELVSGGVRHLIKMHSD